MMAVMQTVIQFELTQDAALIKRIITDPEVYPMVSDDGSPAPEDFQPVIAPNVLYVLVRIEGTIAGLWILLPSNSFCYEIHTVLLPWCRGRRAFEAAKQLGPWLWENTRIERVFTNVPEFNKEALLFARVSGMIQFGKNVKSFKKGGMLYDETLLGVSRCQ